MRLRSPLNALCACVTFALAVTAIAPSARADATESDTSDAKEASRAAFRRGVALLQKGAFPAARTEFEEAYRLFPHPSILLNLGTTRAKTGEYVRAEEDLMKFLADDGGAPPNEVQGARETLAQVRTHLGTFKLRVDTPGARAMLDGTTGVALAGGEATRVRTTIGSHSLHVEANGYGGRELAFDVFATEERAVEVRLLPAVVPPTSQSNPRRVAGWITIGFGGAIAAFGIFSGVYAIERANAYNTRGTEDFQNANVRTTGATFRTLADVSFITAAACLGVGVALVVTAPRTTVSANGSGVWLTQTFW